MRPCASCGLVFGIGRHRTRTGRGPRTRRFASALRPPLRRRVRREWFRPMRSTTATRCCCSIRWPCRERSSTCGRPPAGDRADVPVARARHPELGGPTERGSIRASSRRRQPGRGLAACRGPGRGASVLGGRSAARRSRGVPGKGAERRRALDQSRRAVIAGDTLVDFGQGLEIPPEWLPDGVTPTQVTEGRARCSSGRSSMCSPRTVGLAIRPPRARALLTPVRGYRYSVVGSRTLACASLRECRLSGPIRR